MPGLAPDQATLDEILEVRGEPLNENELWSVLLESGNALKSVLSKTAQERLLHLALTLRPDTLLLCLNGRIKFAITKHAKANKHFIAPESFEEDGKCTSTKIEKMLVYCLGMTALAATENGLDPHIELKLSANLENLLYSMVEDSAARRCSIRDIIEICVDNIDLEECYSKIRILAAEIVGPYGLVPLAKFPKLPKIPKLETDSYNSSIAPLTPVSTLPPVGRMKTKNRSHDITDIVDHPLSSRPPVIKASITPRPSKKLKKDFTNDLRQSESNKPWSPSISSPDLMTLMELEKEKMKASGYLRDQPRLLMSPNKSLSMPSLNDVDDDSSEAPYMQADFLSSNKDYKSKPLYHSAGIIHNRPGSMTSQNSSSQMSLTHGAYVLDSDRMSWSQEFPMVRSKSGSSITYNSGHNRLPLRPPEQLDLVNLGPEFVRITNDPNKAFVDIAPPRLGPLPKGTRKVDVNLPNNQKIQTNVQVSSKVKDVFDQIVEYISLKETIYFGLTQVKDGEELFLELDTKLSKYAPVGWKDDSNKKKKAEFVLYFRVKYFLQDPRLLKHCLTIHLYYLQLRQFLLNGYLQCQDDSLIHSTSYALQAEYGDFLPEYEGVEYFKKEFYIPGKILSRLNRADLLRNLPRLHQSRSGLSKEEAELAFLVEVSMLSEYGIVFHKVSRSKKNENDYVWLGIRIPGIVVLEPRGTQRTVVHEQKWDTVKEFTFDKKKFTLKPKKPDESPKLVFYTNHYRKSKYLFNLCQSFHRFEVYNENRMNQFVIKKPSREGQQDPRDRIKRDAPEMSPHDISLVERKIVVIHLKKRSDEGLGLVIVGGEDSKRLTHGVFIKSIKPNSICGRDGRLSEGDKIISVNEISLEMATHEQAAEILKQAGNVLTLVVSKSSSNVSLLEKSGLSPGMNNSQAQKYNNWDSMLGENEELKKKLSGINLVDEDESEGQYSERAIDVPDEGTMNKYLTQSSMYDDPADLEKTMDDVVDKLLHHNDKIETPRANVIVNDVTIDDAEDEDSLMTESDFHDNNSRSQSNLKRFSGFESLDKLNELSDDDVNDYSHDNKMVTQVSEQQDISDQENVEEEEDESGQSLVNRTLDQTIDEVDVEVMKINGSFGFSVQGGKESNLPLGSIYVKQVYPGGGAAHTKKIKEGDRILAVNGISLEDISHELAVEILRKAPNKSIITLDHGIELPEDITRSPEEEPINDEITKLKKDDGVFEVTVEKRENGLGLSLVGGKGSDICYKGNLMIRKLFSGHVMHDCGRFLVGDILLVINDQILDGMTYQEAIAVIRAAPKMVNIIAKRPPRIEIPSELFETSRPVSPEKLMKDSKLLQVSGRSSSREGHRLAKELLQSLKDVEEDSMDVPLSSIIAYSQVVDCDEEDGSDVDAEDDLPEDPVDIERQQEGSLVSSDIESEASSRSFSVDSKVVSERVDPKDDTDGVEKLTSEITRKVNAGGFEGVPSDTESSSFIGFPRRRPIQKQESIKEQQIEMHGTLKNTVQKPNDIQQTKFTNQKSQDRDVQKTEVNEDKSNSHDSQEGNNDTNFSPRHQQSPLLYSNSPSALKNLNAATNQSPSKEPLTRRSSTISRASSVGEIILIQLEKGDKGLGITLATNNESSTEPFVYIKKLVPGSVADQNGRLRSGDRILSVNGTNVEDHTQKEIIAIFRQLTGIVSMECYRYPELSPSHKPYLPDENSSLTLPKVSPSPPKYSENTCEEPVKEDIIIKQVQMESMAPSSSTPNEFSEKIASEDITFNSNDGLSFADSLADPEDNALTPTDPALILPSPPATAQPYEGDTDTESTHNELSALDGLNELGIYIEPPEEEIKKAANFEPTLSQRPPSGSSSARNTVRGTSGIPRPIRSRSSSLASDGSGSLSRRSSTDTSSNLRQDRKQDQSDLDKSFDGFILKKDYVYYTKSSVDAVLLSLRKKMETTTLNAEFMALRQIKCLGSCDTGNRASNRSKNRIKNVLPYDKNRVQLAGGEESDYINASLIKLPVKDQKTSQYVVTQAPLESTICDFWRCVWEKKIEVIVMLTREEENGKVKCHNYWPSVKKTPMKLLDKFTIELLYEEFNGSFIYRQIQIHNLKMDKSLFVTHAAYTQWPGSGVPKDPIDFLGFMKFVRNFSSSSITLVHCSVGVGRSGIYAVVDNVWNCIEEDLKVDVEKTIQQAKEQRQMLIQTKEQYGFIYQAIHELFQDLDNTLNIR